MNYLKFVHIEDKPKTKIFKVVSSQNPNMILGFIKWYGSFRKYCFFPERETIYDSACLNEISYFCKEVTEEHKRVKI